MTPNSPDEPPPLPSQNVPPPLPTQSQPVQSIKLKRRKIQEEVTYTGAGSTIGDHKEVSEIDAVIREMGAIFYNTVHQSWISVADVDETLQRAFTTVEAALAVHEELTFSINDEKLRVNKTPHNPSDNDSKMFVKHLENMEAYHFTFYLGLSRVEFNDFIGLLTLTRDELQQKGGFYDAVNGEQLEFIKAVKVSFQEVTEEETVLSKRELKKKLEEERVQAEQDVMAMLNGQEGMDDDQLAASAHAMASDSKGMAGLIMQAAEQNHFNDGGTGTKSAAVVTCLRRAFNGLMKDPSLKTQKGKKALMKTLRALENDIHLQMGEVPDAEEKKAVTEAIETMEDELRMDSITAEYTKRLKAIEQSEKRILRFIKAQGMDDVEDSDLAMKLSSAGLDVSGWHALLAKSHATAPDRRESETEDGALAAVGNLAALLGQLETDAVDVKEQPDGENPEKLAEHLAEVDKEVKAITAETEHKIMDLVGNIKGDMKEQAAGKKSQLSRQKLLKGLAEIAQELCQPLSVINCSVSMVTSKALGDVPDAQVEMLNMAHDATERIKALIDALQEISDVPPDLTPDSRLQEALYDQD